MNEQPAFRDWDARRNLGRGKHAACYGEKQAEEYAAIPGMGFFEQDHRDAHIADIQSYLRVRSGLEILEVGAGTGAFTEVLAQFPEARITATDPSAAMCRVWRSRMANRKEPSRSLEIQESSCDAVEDRSLFPASRFDLIACRNVINGLFDPLTAFANWHFWLKPGGHVLVLDAIFGRDGWKGEFGELVDLLPLSCTQSLATIPYLLNVAGFQVEGVGWLERVNTLPSTRTPRYLVLATR